MVNAAIVNAGAVNGASGDLSWGEASAALIARVTQFPGTPIDEDVVGGVTRYFVHAALSVSTIQVGEVRSAWLRVRAVDVQTVQLALRASAGATLGVAEVQAPLRARAVAVESVSTPIGALWVSVRQAVSVDPVAPNMPPPPGSVGGSYHDWCISAQADPALQVTGSLRVSAEEHGARTASLTVLGDATSQVGQRITLALQVGGAQSLLYRGRIVSVRYDPDTDTSAMDCSDQLQRIADSLDKDQIDRLTPQALSQPGQSATGYAYLMQRLSTSPASAILRADGRLAVVPWSVQGGRTVTRMLSGSFKVQATSNDPLQAQGGGSSSTSPASSLPRKKVVKLTIELSWIRAARMRFNAGWRADYGLCEWLDGWPLPQPETIEQAVYGCGWDVTAFSYARLPLTSRWIGCGGAMRALLVAPGTVAPAIGANWSLSKRYTRTMKAVATWLIKSADTVPDAPVDVVERRITLKDPRDGRDWVDFGAGAPSLGIDANGDEYADLLDVRDGTAQFGQALGEASDTISAAMQAIAYAVAQAAVTVQRDNRGLSATATLPIDPTLDIGDALTLQHPRRSVSGMVTSITHSLDTTSGQAVTEVQVKALTATTPSSSPSPTPRPDFPPGGQTHTIASGNWTGGLLANTLQRATLLPTRRSDTELPKPCLSLIGGTREYLSDATNDPLFQGWIGNKPQSVIVAGNQPPKFYPQYEHTGFFVRSPQIALPDQDQVLDLGQSTLIV